MEDRTTITEGHDRLTLQFEGGFFRALVWSSEHGRDWRARAVITQSDFQRGSGRNRWVSELHSFDPAAGHAIIKVGEHDVPSGEHIRVVYSWREWDLLANHEVQMLKVCTAAFQDFETAMNAKDDPTIIIDCKDEDWDSVLYESLGYKRLIELRNLHPSYENYMKQLAEMSAMEFVGHFAEYRGGCLGDDRGRMEIPSFQHATSEPRPLSTGFLSR